MTDAGAPGAVVFGAGNIGRGFIGQLFCEAGLHVTFVDVDDTLVRTLAERGTYVLESVFDETVTKEEVGPVSAVHAADAGAVTRALDRAAVGATAVGVRALDAIAPHVAAGLLAKSERNAPPFNIILCENLKNAAAHFRNLVVSSAAPAAQDYLQTRTGFVDTVIGRMVPLQTDAMRRGDPTRIRVEPYKVLPVNRAQFVGPIPAIPNMHAEGHFERFTARKLYVHNCGHALLAYVGYLLGFALGYEALDDLVVDRFVRGGLAESIAGIAPEYGVDREWLQEHVDDLMVRFRNRALGDTLLRLGRDPLRKLAAGDRLTGAARLAEKALGEPPQHLSLGIAAALLFDAPDDPAARNLQALRRENSPEAVLESVAGINPGEPLAGAVLSAYHDLVPDPGRRMRHQLQRLAM